MNELRIVSGYLPEIDRPLAAAEQAGLRKRVGIVFSDDEIPPAFYWALIDRILGLIPHDSVTFALPGHDLETTLQFDSLAAMQKYVLSQRDYRRPFDQAELWSQGALVCIIKTEPYALCGGPWPYSDSWTFSLYHSSADSGAIEEACHRICAAHSVKLLERVQGLPTPHISYWTRFLAWWESSSYTPGSLLTFGAIALGFVSVLERHRGPAFLTLALGLALVLLALAVYLMIREVQRC